MDDSRTIAFNTTLNPSALPDFLIREREIFFSNLRLKPNTFSDYFNDMKTSNGYKKCQFEDLDPFHGCKPVNCELKYFGKRNFFDNASCVRVTTCDQDEDSIYDYETNECIASINILSNEDREQMKQGKFSNWIETSEVREGGTIPYEVSFCCKVMNKISLHLYFRTPRS